MNKSAEYQSTIDWLFQQFPSYQLIGSKAYKPTLENISRILDEIDRPQDGLSFVHVAGSNGKGSVCSIISSTLTESGNKVGLFTSPHLLHFGERIRINGEQISESAIISFVKRIKAINFNFEPSFFEITFAMAIEHFAGNKCDVCVIETGLGGRLDATNVIHPLLSIITTISLEHTDILGNTLEEIALEKAGIIKRGRPVLVGNISEDPRRVIEKIAEERKSNLYSIEYDPQESYQKENEQVAYRALEVLKVHGLEVDLTLFEISLEHLAQNTGFGGRMEVVNENPKIVLDVSHNIDGLSRTFKEIETKKDGTLIVIYATSSDKKIDGISEVFPNNSTVILTEFDSERAMPLAYLATNFHESNYDKLICIDNVESALSKARKLSSPSDTILVTGSFFLIGEIIPLIEKLSK